MTLPDIGTAKRLALEIAGAATPTAVALTVSTEEFALVVTILTLFVGVITWSVRVAGHVSAQGRELRQMRIDLGREIKQVRTDAQNDFERLEKTTTASLQRIETTVGTLVNLQLNRNASGIPGNYPQ